MTFFRKNRAPTASVINRATEQSPDSTSQNGSISLVQSAVDKKISCTSDISIEEKSKISNSETTDVATGKNLIGFKGDKIDLFQKETDLPIETTAKAIKYEFYPDTVAQTMEKNRPLKKRREVGFDGNLMANRADQKELRVYAQEQREDVVVNNFEVKPVTLETANLDAKLLHNIKHLQHYTELLPLQEYCLSTICNDQRPDVLVQSPTGSGKTAAFGIPAVQIASEYKGNAPSVIIVCNTMNLAMQIYEHICLFAGRIPLIERRNANPMNLEIFGMYKGGDNPNLLKKDGHQPDIIVGTMGMLNATLEKDKLILSNLRLVIADEADKMVRDGGFADEIRKFLGMLPKEVKDRIQIAAFSATFSYFEDDNGDIDFSIGALGEFFKHKQPVIIKVNGVKGYITQRLVYVNRKIERLTTEVSNNPNLYHEYARQCVRNSYYSRKLGYLLALLDEDKRKYFKNGRYEKTSIVFVERITTSNFLATYLIMKGYKVAPLNSNYDLKSVKETLNKLVNGELQAVISTNKLARGQDIPDLHHVIVYEMSNDFDDYKHRIGRTGRIGKGGISTALVTDQDSKHFSGLFHFLYEHGQKIPMWLHDHIEFMDNQHNYGEQFERGGHFGGAGSDTETAERIC